MTVEISILMPAYNAELYLEIAIESVLSQDANLELVICNDGSSDRTEDIAYYYADEDARVRVLTQTNAGVAVARNRAFAHSRGQWVCFFDADDCLSEG